MISERQQRGEGSTRSGWAWGPRRCTCSMSPLSTCCCTWSSSEAWVPSSQKAVTFFAVVEGRLHLLVAVDEGDLLTSPVEMYLVMVGASTSS